jgi:glycosyltransferase involved in cell wall biosynthesis
MKKALVFDPYLDTLGGGERYSLTFAKTLDLLGFETYLAWGDETIVKNAENRFGLDLKNIKFDPEGYSLLKQKANLKKRFNHNRQYDLIFYLSDGSLPFLFAKKNLVHFQVPFKKIGGNYLINKLKISYIDRFVYNSNFTRKVLENNLPKKKSVVLYPPVSISQISPSSKKENIILSVGRFDSPSHSKRQDILIKCFQKLPQDISSKYKLILTGGLMSENQYLDSLKNQSQGYNIEIITNLKFPKLKEIYSKSKIFWHAAGYEIDEKKHPDKVEHFGITTVEAMAAGCIPVVINKGGQKEIITKDCGFLADNIDEMVKFTTSLVKSETERENYSRNAIKRSQDFSEEKFREKIINFL